MVNRIQPLMPVQAYRSFTIAAPLETHWVTTTCERAACDQIVAGWQTIIDEATDLGQRQAHYIRCQSGRRFTEELEPTGLTCFTFEPGQRCFREHKAPSGRPERFIERDGDWRGNPSGRRREHVRPDDWVDSFATHQQEIADLVRRG